MTREEIEKLEDWIEVPGTNEVATLAFLDRQTGDTYGRSHLEDLHFGKDDNLKWLEIIYIL